MEPFGLQAWVDRLRREELPIFGRTAHEVSRLTERSSVPVSLLANVILQDASMTARIIKLANSSFYPKGAQVTTVSRAVTLLGFDIVRGICLSVALIDSLLKGKPREQLLLETGRAFYAAALARTLAKHKGDESPEEVFIAALLYRLGEMAFWCFGGRSAEKLEALLEEPQVSRTRAEQTLLGCKLSTVTLELAKHWKLGGMLISALTGDGGEQSRSHAIVIAHQLAMAIRDDADSVELTRHLKQLCRYTNLSLEAVEEMLADCSELAADIAFKFGAQVSVPLIPGQKREISQEVVQMPLIDVARAVEASYPDPDPLPQLRILRELVMSGEKDPDIEMIVQLALEGMYRGVGLDRAVFMAISADGRTLAPKSALGPDSERLFRQFVVALDPDEPNIFFDCLTNFQSVWAPLLPSSEEKILSAEVLGIVRRGPFILTPVRVRGETCGLFYGDRLLSQRQLDSESSESFELFAFQVNQILQH